MNVLQSTIEPILIIALLISNILFVRSYKRENTRLKSLNEELERGHNSAIGLASERVKDIEILKGMYSPELLKQYLHMHVTVEINKVKTEAEQKANEDRKMIEALNDHLNEAISYLAFMLHIERKYTRDQRISFFHTYFSKGKDLFWYITNQKIELIENKKAQIRPEILDATNTPDATAQ